MSSLWALYALWDEPEEWQINVYRVLLIINLLVSLGILWFSPFLSVCYIIVSGVLLWWTFNRDEIDYTLVWWFNFWSLIASLIGALVFGLATIPFVTLYQLHKAGKLKNVLDVNKLANAIGNKFKKTKNSITGNQEYPNLDAFLKKTKKSFTVNSKNNNNSLSTLSINNNPSEFNINKPINNKNNNKPNFNVKKMNN